MSGPISEPWDAYRKATEYYFRTPSGLYAKETHWDDGEVDHETSTERPHWWPFLFQHPVTESRHWVRPGHPDTK